ncbi:MAG: VanZ like family [Bacteroidota bacterium]
MNKLRFSFVCIFFIITVLSLTPPKSVIELSTNDKVGHYLAYLAFGMNCCLFFDIVTRKLLVFLLAILGYSILIEFIQGFIGRTLSIYDFIANSLGVLTSLIIFSLFRNQIKSVLVKIHVISPSKK